MLLLLCAVTRQLLDKLHMDDRHADKPLRVPVLDRYTDRGTMALGKVEQVSSLLLPVMCHVCNSSIR